MLKDKLFTLRSWLIKLLAGKALVIINAKINNAIGDDGLVAVTLRYHDSIIYNVYVNGKSDSEYIVEYNENK